MKQIMTLFLTLVCMCSVWAQEGIGSDTLFVEDSIVASKDSIEVSKESVVETKDAIEVSNDSIDTSDVVSTDVIAEIQDSQHVDTLVVEIPYCPVTSTAVESNWRKWSLAQEIPYSTIYRIREQMELEGCPEVDSLHAVVDSIPFNSELMIGVADLRLPIVYDPKVLPRQSATISNLRSKATDSAEINQSLFMQQLQYADMRRGSIQRFASRNLSEIGKIKGKGMGRNNPFERRRIDRKEFEITELVITDAALDLASAQLDIEQVTFHADKWHRKGSTSLQISQTALSSNWYKGGDNNMTMSTYDKLTFSRYDESLKTTLDIAFELRLSGYYTAADTINPVRVNDNQLRIDVSYGYKAWKNWYYSTSFYAKTPLLDFHAANSKVTKSTFFSPLETNLGIGLDYKKTTLDKRTTFNLMLAPLSYSVTSVSSDRVDVKQFGIDEGDKTKHQFGSSVTCKLDWKITDMLSWNTRFYYFTTYKSVLVEFENNVNIQLGKYCSAKFYYYPRIDDSRDNRFECKQMLTFGLSWVW